MQSAIYCNKLSHMKDLEILSNIAMVMRVILNYI